MRRNRHVNPGLSVATTGWTQSATSAAMRRIASPGPGVGTEYIGDGYARGRPVFRTTGAQNGLAEVVEGLPTVLSVYAYHGAGASRQCTVDADLVNSAGSVVRTVAQNRDVPHQTWTRFAVPFVPQRGEVRVSTWVGFFTRTAQSVPTDAYVAIAAAMIEDAESVGDYRDGDFPGWEWLGTPGLSASTEIPSQEPYRMGGVAYS